MKAQHQRPPRRPDRQRDDRPPHPGEAERITERRTQADLTNLARGQRSERERNKLLAQMSLESLLSMEDWLRAAPRSEEDIATIRRVRAELQAMAIHGYESTVEFVSVNRVIQSVNGLPYGVWKAQQDAYQADVERFLQ